MTAPAHVTETADNSSVAPDPVVETEDERRTRLSVYQEIKRLLVAQGIPEHEIAFVHDYEGPAAQAELSRKLNAGEIRIVLASTTKLGVGANIQQRLYAIHHGDPPWVPASIEQRDGRMLRQGNIYPEVHICQYVTEGSFDAYSWQLLENKSRFISQVMRGEAPARVAEDVDLAVLTASQIKAIASGNPLVLEKVGLETELTRLDRLYATWSAGRNRLRYDLVMLPEKIGKAEYGFNLTDSDAGIIQSMDARLRSIDKRLVEAEETRRQLTDRCVKIEVELAKGWEYATKFQELRARLDALNASMRIEGLITEDPLQLTELSEEAFLPAVPKLNDIPSVVGGIEPAAGFIESAADDKSLDPQTELVALATYERAVPVPTSLETTGDRQSPDLRIEAAVPTAPENGVEENPASEARAASTTTDWDELFAWRERIKAEREMRPSSKRRASPHSSAQLSFDWS